jgi:hypothetical protein
MRHQNLALKLRLFAPVLSLVGGLAAACTQDAGSPPSEAVSEGAFCPGGTWWNPSTSQCEMEDDDPIIIDTSAPAWPWPTTPPPDDDPPPGGWEPSDDPGGGGGDPTDPICAAPSTTQQTNYGQARQRALCALGVGECGALLSTAESGSPWQLLSDLDVRGQIYPNCPAKSTDVPSKGVLTYATTVFGPGPSSTILLRPPFHDWASAEMRVIVLLHEIGHATGRIPSDHGSNYPGDPNDSDGWDSLIGKTCLYSGEAIKKCGKPGSW